MARDLSPVQIAERSIIRKYRRELWKPFIRAVQRYGLIQPGDRIAVCISGGKDSMLMAKLMQELHRHTDHPFSLSFLVMDPGYSAANRRKIEENARLLQVPITVFETDIFSATENIGGSSPCYLCARMRRGHLYSRARALGCNKIALGHHLNDVIETTLLGMFYGAQLQAMMPKLHSTNFPGMELIRPLYCIREEHILAWGRYNHLEFIQCACRMTEGIAARERGETAVTASRRQEIKALIRDLRRTNPNIEKNLFRSIHNLALDTFPRYKTGGQEHCFLETYGASGGAEPDPAFP